MAWIEKRQRQHHVAHKVYWRDPSGKVRTRTFTRAADAQRFARESSIARTAATTSIRPPATSRSPRW